MNATTSRTDRIEAAKAILPYCHRRLPEHAQNPYCPTLDEG